MSRDNLETAGTRQGHGGAYKGQVFVDEQAIIVQLQWVLGSQRERSRGTRYLQINRPQFGADS